MKFIFTTLFTICTLSIFAAFPGWNSMDKAAYQEYETTLDKEKSIGSIGLCRIIIWALDNPKATYAEARTKSITIFQELFPSRSLDSVTRTALWHLAFIVVQHTSCKQAWANDMRADTEVMKNTYAALYLVAANESQPVASRLATAVYVLKTDTDIARLLQALHIYLDLTNDSPDEEVVPVLKSIYRKRLPEVAENDAYKPLIVRLTLALKARGVNL